MKINQGYNQTCELFRTQEIKYWVSLKSLLQFYCQSESVEDGLA